MQFLLGAEPGCMECVVLHSCFGGPSVLMCKDAWAVCRECKGEIAAETEYQPGHAFVDCYECGRYVGLCAGNDLIDGLNALLGIKQDMTVALAPEHQGHHHQLPDATSSPSDPYSSSS